MKHLVHAAVAAAAIATITTPALAATTASASIGPLTIRLIDLDLADGIAPSITFRSDLASISWTSASVPEPSGVGSLLDTDFGNTLWTTSMASVNNGSSQAQADITTNGAPGGTTYSVSGRGVQFSATAFGGQTDADFTLSANTLLLIQASADGTATGSNITGGFLNVLAGLEVFGAGSLGSGLQRSTDSVGVIFQNSVPANLAWSDAKSLSVSFTNLQNRTLDGGIRVEAYVFSSLTTAPVPEPETYALMLAGLAAIGLMARRRG